MLHFKPERKHEIKGRGTVYSGPCPLDGLTPETNIRNHVGDLVDINGVVYRIKAVETFAKVPPPSLGETVGILVSEPHSFV